MKKNKIILKSQINIKYWVNKGDRNTLQKMLSLEPIESTANKIKRYQIKVLRTVK